MGRFKYLLEQPTAQESKLIGLFPFDTLIDSKLSNVNTGNLSFLESGAEALKILSQKNYSVVLFINQFKSHPLPMEHFQSLNQAIDNFVKSTGMKLENIYWCPNTDRNDPFVVPNPGMFNRATENQGINWEGIPVISTFNNDLTAASRVKAHPIKIGTGTSSWPQYNTLFEWVMTL